MATFEEYLFVKNTKWIFWGVGALIAFLFIFRAGMEVGFHDALRSHGLDRRPPQSGPFGFSMDDGTIPGHGAVGAIATVTLPTLLLKTRDGMTEQIELASSTVIRDANGATLTAESLKPGDTIVVIGEPVDSDDLSGSEIDARLIRLLPALPPAPTTTMQIMYKVQSN